MTATTLDGVLLKGVAASRPAASAVAKGTIYSATDTGAITQSDGVSTWSAYATLSSRASLGLATSDSPEFAAVNVGHASDTTITRVSAGNLAVEGNALYRAGGTDVPIGDGGTGASTKAAAFDALSPMTTQDDIVIGGASGTGVRLGKGSDGQVLTVDPATHHLVWATPSGGGGGGGVLASTMYSTGSDTIWASSSSTTPADIDATNAALAITVPASGKIVVMATLDFTFSTANTGGYLVLRTGSTDLQASALITHNSVAGGVGGMAKASGHAVAHFYVTGLTPGALTIKLGFARLGSAVLEVYANDGTGAANHLASPFVMTAFAA